MRNGPELKCKDFSISFAIFAKRFHIFWHKNKSTKVHLSTLNSAKVHGTRCCNSMQNGNKKWSVNPITYLEARISTIYLTGTTFKNKYETEYLRHKQMHKMHKT